VAQADWLGGKVGGHPALMLYSSDEPGELSQWLFVCCVCLSGVCFAVGVCTVS